MKALAILVTCCAAVTVATPSRALVHATGPQLVLHHGGHGAGAAPGRHDRHGAGNGFDGAFAPAIFPEAPAPDTATAPAEPVFDLPPAILCPTGPVTPAAARPGGPHIIYINQKPAATKNAPKVIYGTQ